MLASYVWLASISVAVAKLTLLACDKAFFCPTDTVVPPSKGCLLGFTAAYKCHGGNRSRGSTEARGVA